MKVVKFYRSALSRQVGEAIRILKRGVVLNSRSEFNRCSISRLTLEQKENDILNQNQSEEDFATDWSGPLLARRDESDRSLRRKLGRAGKRCGMKREQDEGAGAGRRKKRRKYQTLDEDWGLAVEDGGEAACPSKAPTKVRKAVLSIEWDVYRLNVLALEWESGVVSEGLSQGEYVFDQVENDKVECGASKTSVESMKKSVNNKETGKASGNRKQKVWTRLRNGLYGWRTTKVGKRRQPKNDDPNFSKDCRSSTPPKWEPEIWNLV